MNDKTKNSDNLHSIFTELINNFKQNYPQADIVEYDMFNWSADGFFWVTGDGKSVKVSDMETSHIKNVIAFLVKKQKEDGNKMYLNVRYSVWKDIFRGELNVRSEKESTLTHIEMLQKRSNSLYADFENTSNQIKSLKAKLKGL